MDHVAQTLAFTLLAALAPACRQPAGSESATTNPARAAGTWRGPESVVPPGFSEEDVAAGELADLLALAAQRVEIPAPWARAPERDDERRWPWFERRQEMLWNLELEPARVRIGTVLDASRATEEGGSVGEYVVFLRDRVEWWFDGRGDAYAEFRAPAVRSARVVRVFLAVFDGSKGYAVADRAGGMPMTRGLAVGVEFEDGSRRYL